LYTCFILADGDIVIYNSSGSSISLIKGVQKFEKDGTTGEYQ
jgi:hypothetical protein